MKTFAHVFSTLFIFGITNTSAAPMCGSIYDLKYQVGAKRLVEDTARRRLISIDKNRYIEDMRDFPRVLANAAESTGDQFYLLQVDRRRLCIIRNSRFSSSNPSPPSELIETLKRRDGARTIKVLVMSVDVRQLRDPKINWDLRPLLEKEYLGESLDIVAPGNRSATWWMNPNQSSMSAVASPGSAPLTVPFNSEGLASLGADTVKAFTAKKSEWEKRVAASREIPQLEMANSIALPRNTQIASRTLEDNEGRVRAYTEGGAFRLSAGRGARKVTIRSGSELVELLYRSKPDRIRAVFEVLVAAEKLSKVGRTVERDRRYDELERIDLTVFDFLEGTPLTREQLNPASIRIDLSPLGWAEPRIRTLVLDLEPNIVGESIRVGFILTESSEIETKGTRLTTAVRSR